MMHKIEPALHKETRKQTKCKQKYDQCEQNIPTKGEREENVNKN